MLKEEDFGKGGRKRRIDLRDHKDIGKAGIPFNWNIGFDIKDTAVTKDQGQSDSCGGQAGAYLNQRLQGGDQSAKSIYSLVWVKGGGSSMRDVFKTICKRGVNLEKDVPSIPSREKNLTDRTWITPVLDVEAQNRKGLNYAFINTDIDSVAQAIRDTGGCILLVEGQNGLVPGWLSTIPTPPKNNKNIWRHFLFAGAAKIVNGKKSVKVHNSWGNDAGDNGWQWLTEDYFKSGHVVEVGVLYKATSEDTQTVNQTITLIQKLINLCYQLIDKMK